LEEILIVVSLLIIGYFLLFVGKGYVTAYKLMKEKPILEYYEGLKKKSTYFPIEQISTNIKFLVLCLEDADFFRHHGYNAKRILYAFYRNIGKKDLIGGSTITQQLAKNMYFSFKKSYKRKIAELFVARKLEKTLSKEQIFDMYLNIIYYGMEQYNIKDACEFYFGRTPAEVSLNQGLTLACLLPAPTNYNPLSSHGLFGQARNIGLKRLIYLNVMKQEDTALFRNTSYNEDVADAMALAYEARYHEQYFVYSKKKKRLGTLLC